MNPPSNDDIPVRLIDPVIDRSGNPKLLFTPYAWAKLKYMCHSVPTEIGGMGITLPDDPFTVTDIAVIKQHVTAAFVEFDSDSLADHMMKYCDPEGAYRLNPVNCMRIWIHTHPNGVAGPSYVDETTFTEAFGAADWAVMFILVRSGEVYARLRTTTASGVTQNIELPVDIAWDTYFPQADHDLWLAEITSNVFEKYTPFVQPVKRWDAKAVVSPKSYTKGKGVKTYEEAMDAYSRYHDWDNEVLNFDDFQAPQFPSAHRDIAPLNLTKRPYIDIEDMHPLNVLPRETQELLFGAGQYLTNDRIVELGAEQWSEIVEDLKRLGVTWDGDTSSTHVYFTITEGDNFTNSRSLELPLELAPKAHFKMAICDEALQDYKQVEAAMQKHAASRWPADFRTKNHKDIFGTLVDTFYPYRTVDGSAVMWLAFSELETLSDVESGLTSYLELFNDSGVAREAYNDNTIIDGGPFRFVDDKDVWVSVLRACVIARGNGDSIAQLNSTLDLMASSIDDPDDSDAFAAANKLLLDVGYDPEKFVNKLPKLRSKEPSLSWVNKGEIIDLRERVKRNKLDG